MTEWVAEIGSNHNGDLSRALKTIEAASLAGATAVKFQLFRVEDLYCKEAVQRVPALSQMAHKELPYFWIPILARHAHDHGLEFGVTPFGERALDVAASNCDFLKVSSYQLKLPKFLIDVGDTDIPVVLSTGMATLHEVDDAMLSLSSGSLTILHCVSSYPTPPDQACLRAIDYMRNMLKIPIGWSDHTKSPMVLCRAVNFHKAEMVEFHFDIDGQGAEYSGGHCWLPHEIAAVIKDSTSYSDPGFYACDGKREKKPMVCETDEVPWRADPSDGLRPSMALREKWRAES